MSESGHRKYNILSLHRIFAAGGEQKKTVVSVGTGTAILVILLQYVNKCKHVPLSFSRGGSVFESV